MPLAHQFVLGVIAAGFVIFYFTLMSAWIWTKGWASNAPDNRSKATGRKTTSSSVGQAD